MSYKVLNTFKEKEHKNTVYSVGESYPKEGFDSNKKRVTYLQEIHHEYGVRFLETVEDKPVVKTPKINDSVPVENKETSKKKSDTK